MRRKTTLGMVATAALLLGAGACDLDVTNPNEPDRERALAAPEDVEALIGSAYGQYWRTAHVIADGLGATMEVTADHITASWGNFAARSVGEEPRIPWDNNPSFAYAYTSEDHWGGAYRAVSAASDGLRAIDAGLEIGPGGERNQRAAAFAKFMQGLGHGQLALAFDQGFQIDETTDFEAEQSPVPYTQVLEFAIQKLEEARQIASSNSFTLDNEWIRGVPATSAEFVRIINSYLARFKANVARDFAERQGLNWADIEANVDAGITQDVVIDGVEAPLATTLGGTPWWDGIKTWSGSDPGWTRVDLAWIGQGDVSGGYQDWIASEASRNPFNVVTPDLRLPQNPGTEGDRGLYLTWTSSTLLPPGRGTHHLSNYFDHRWEAYVNTCDGCWSGPIAEMSVREMRLIKAEARYHQGDLQGAADIINETRVGNGGLPAITPAGTSGAACVPRKRWDPAGTCGDLLDALQWEHYQEISQLSAGLTYYFTRGHDELQAGSVLHWPIPGAELETLQMDIYTFGGVSNAGQPGTAPEPSLLNRGGLEPILDKVSYDLQMLEWLDSPEVAGRPDRLKR